MQVLKRSAWMFDYQEFKGGGTVFTGTSSFLDSAACSSLVLFLGTTTGITSDLLNNILAADWTFVDCRFGFVALTTADGLF
ncbi:hypothetical protein MIMGU_mgv1a017347mg [Erythranthe guttata]|uniref:Uncharacterized protein n=1 Tax=Erythranthe guttata TaxID=4155 RepID=A0A022QRM0_ERYGU|nr:hypothetical protein MIMGU_mgv1a017347mg [Erythranthe guttata]